MNRRCYWEFFPQNENENFRKGLELLDSNKNLKLGIELLKNCAEKGSSAANFYLGSCYFFGKYVGANLLKGLLYFEKAAQKGDFYAQYFLGQLYYTGKYLSYKIINSNYDKALQYLNMIDDKKIANDNNYILYGKYYFLGNLYGNGFNIKKDIHKGNDFLKKADIIANNKNRVEPGWFELPFSNYSGRGPHYYDYRKF